MDDRRWAFAVNPRIQRSPPSAKWKGRSLCGKAGALVFSMRRRDRIVFLEDSIKIFVG
ncbi:MAG: hypothetical protein ACE5L7_08225 [Candidatus Aminicenantales bacterium]